jgi:hypothetical protein
MRIFSKADFQSVVRSHVAQTRFVVVKPNWVSNVDGDYTDAVILSWFLESLQSDQKVLVVESYTPWRGLNFSSGGGTEELRVDLISGREHWEFYRKQDECFLEQTGLAQVLSRHHVEYINITDEYWKGNCCRPEEIGQELSTRSFAIRFSEFLSYIPKAVYDVRGQATFVSLAKIKIEREFENIVVSLSLKNLFGLIPHPLRDRYHGPMHRDVPQAIADINKVYASLFRDSLWIAEGVQAFVEHYCTEDRTIGRNSGLLFVGKDPLRVDTQVCKDFGIDPADVPYFEYLSGVWA